MKQTLPINGKFQLIELPYAADALEPAISQQTISFHHGKHLQAYVNNLNALLPGSPYEGMSLEEIVTRSTGQIFNNAGQILNHNLFFSQFTRPRYVCCKRAGEADTQAEELPRPIGELAAAIIRDFQSIQRFRDYFTLQANKYFGSGWIWLSANAKGHLEISLEANAGNPVQHGNTPLLTFDLWEHAYYLDYQNRRPDYVNALWTIVDWDVVAKRYRDLAKPTDW